MSDEKRFIPWVTIAIAVLNVGVFGWEIAAGGDLLQPSAQWMIEHGGNFAPVTYHGEQWRLFTSMFLHYGLLHIAMNMIGLIDGGRHVEKMYGRWGFIALYLVSGLAGSLASSLRSANVASAGASGAIFGVFGAFGAFLYLHRARLDVEQVKKQARGLMIFLAYNIYFGLTAKGIDLVAHLGGLAGGFLIGIALEIGTTEDQSTVKRSALVGILGTILVIGISLMVKGPSNALQEFLTVETTVIEKWNAAVPKIKSGEMTDEQAADLIEKELLPAWKVAHDKYEKDGDGPLRDDMIGYILAREDGWRTMAPALRNEDLAGVQAGMARFSEGDAILQRLKTKL